MARGFTPEQLKQIDWTTIYQPENHPLKLVVEVQTIRDLATNQVIAEAAPGYRFYWAHDHIHVAPIDWDHRATEKELSAEPTTQVAKPLGGVATSLFASLATSLIPATSSKG
jgi:hypothetical protein